MKRILAAIILCLAATAARAELSLNDILAKMEAADKTTQCVKFDFQQEIVYTLTNEKQTNRGEVIFKKPNSLYMKQNNPLEQVIVSNGKQVWIYTPTYKQVVVDEWKKWASTSMVPASLLNFGSSWKDLKKRYAFSLAGSEEDRYILLLTPKAKDQWKLKLWVSQENWLPVKVSLLGDNFSVTTDAKKHEVNPQVDQKIFNFQAPKGVEVLHLPQ